MLKLYFLGTPRVELNGEVVNLGRRKAVALLAYLVLNPTMNARDSLATLLWGDYDQKRARADLRNTLYAINKKLGDQWLAVEREAVSVSPDADIWIDVNIFQALLNECRTHGHHPDEVCIDCLTPLTLAFEQYQDDFLTGFSLTDAAEFENWQLVQREFLRMELNRTYEKLVRAHSALQEFDEALGYAQDWLQLDVCNEDAHSYLMSLYAWSGQRTAAINQYQKCEQVLMAELETEPFEETVDLYHDILDNQLPALPTIYYPQTDEQIAKEKTAPHHHNLIPQATPFLGREVERSQLNEMLKNPSTRLISIIGLGGMGKTRLAMQIARENLNHFKDGVFFVSLVGANNRTEVGQAIAEAIQYHTENTNEPIEPQLVKYLTQKEYLLILDNFEHLLAEKEIINTLLSATENMKFLVTSRIPLDLKAEWKFDLAGMLIHDETDLADHSAIQLFLENAQRVTADFQPSPQELSHIAEICAKLDGIPLAIELTTSWLRILSPAEILKELTQDLAFLETHHSDIHERHRSLQATFDHSWQLLSGVEQDVFARLSLFRGGFTREAATEIAGAKLQTLSLLAHKSLLKRNAQGRYEIHEMLRQFAEMKLNEDTSLQLGTLQKFGLYYANFLQTREERLKGADQVQAEHEIRAEIENIRYAFSWMTANHRLSLLDKILHGLSLFYGYQDWYEEGALYMQKIVDICEKAILHATDSSFMYRLLGRALTYQASFYNTLNQDDLAQSIAQRSASLLQETDAYLELGLAYRILGLIIRFKQDYEEAAVYFEKSTQAYQRSEDLWGIASAYEALGRFKNFSGNFGAGLPLYEQAYATALEVGNPTLIAEMGTSLCWIEISYSGEYEKALERGLQIIEIFEEIRIIPLLVDAYRAVGSTYVQLGKFDKAYSYYAKAEPLARELGSKRLIFSCIVDYGFWAGESGQHEKCRDYIEEAITLAHEHGFIEPLSMLYGNLAEVNISLDNFAEAERAIEKSLELSNVILAKVTTASNYSRLGVLRTKQGNLAGAEEAHREALHITATNDLVIEGLNFLMEFAVLRHQQGFSREALLYLSYVIPHALSTAATVQDAQSHFDKIAPEFSRDEIAAIQQEATEFDMGIFARDT